MSPKSTPLPKPWQPVPRQFFLDPPELVAPQLLGKLLARRTSAGWLAGRIVEVEAYLGPHITATPDPAAHSFRGVTERNRVMFGPPGHAYVYFIYGMYDCLNIVCEPEGIAGCVLIRALEPLCGIDRMRARRPTAKREEDLANGPGKLTRALGIKISHNGADVTKGPITIHAPEHIEPFEIAISPRIGITKSADLPLRFFIKGNRCVSRR